MIIDSSLLFGPPSILEQVSHIAYRGESCVWL